MVAAAAGSKSTVYVPVDGSEAMSKPPVAPSVNELELTVPPLGLRTLTAT